MLKLVELPQRTLQYKTRGIDCDHLEELLTFAQDTYCKDLDCITEPVNRAIAAQFTAADQKAFAAVFAGFQMDLRDMMQKFWTKKEGEHPPKTDSFTSKWAELFLDLDRQINLSGKIRAFVQAEIKIPDVRKEDRLKDHRKDESFGDDIDEMIDIYCLIMYSKFYAPIFGVFISATKQWFDKHLRARNIPAASLLKRVHDTFYAKTYDKLIGKMCYGMVGRGLENSSTLSMIGATEGIVGYSIAGNVFTRNMLYIDVFSDHNPIAIIHRGIEREIIQFSREARGCPAYTRTIQPVSGRTEPDNSTQLEVDSAVSERPLDTSIIVKPYLGPAIQKVIREFDLDEALYEDILAFMRVKQIRPNRINQFHVVSLFGPYLGGGRSVLVTKYQDYLPLVAATQTFTIAHSNSFIHESTHGDDMEMLVHLMSADMGSTKEPSMEDMAARQGLGGRYYSKLQRQYSEFTSPAINVKAVDRILDGYVNDITSVEFYTNTAPVVWDYFGKPTNNGGLIQIPRDIVPQTCRFLLIAGRQ